jgi:hypothetical protein
MSQKLWQSPSEFSPEIRGRAAGGKTRIRSQPGSTAKAVFSLERFAII